jgi:hypothetical protein
MDTIKTHSSHILDKLVGESHKDFAMSVIQMTLLVLLGTILFLVVYLLVKKVLPVTDTILPLVNTQLIPSITLAEPVLTDVMNTIHNPQYKSKEQLSKIIGDMIWRSDPKTLRYGPPLTYIGKTVNRVETMVNDISNIMSVLEALCAYEMPNHPACNRVKTSKENYGGEQFIHYNANKRNNFCGRAQNIDLQVNPDRALLRKLYNSGQLTENTQLRRGGWKQGPYVGSQPENMGEE